MSIKLGDGQTIEAVDMADLVERNLETPDFQRDLKPEKVDEIVSYQRCRMQETGAYNFLGELTICTTKTHYYLVDGMHRYAAMKRLMSESTVSDEAASTPVVVRFVDLHVSRTSMEQIFLQINLASPMEAYIISSLCQRHQRRIMEDVRRCLQMRFKPYLSDAARPRAPNINSNELVNAVCTLDMLKIFRNDSEKIFRFILSVNEQLKAVLVDDDTDFLELANKKVGGAVVSKKTSSRTANGTNTNSQLMACYIAWQYPEYTQADKWKEWVGMYIAEKPVFPQSSQQTAEGKKKKKARGATRKKVPQALRNNVWRRHFGEDRGSGECVVCKNKITQMMFECGHVVSDANGGKCTEGNLRPVCSGCNKSMGKKNMDVYCKEHGYDWKEDGDPDDGDDDSSSPLKTPTP